MTKSIFGEDLSQKVLSRLNERSDPTLFISVYGKSLVGFKAGYRESPDCYYSWMGGVMPKYRGHGIASRLMKLQHDWCRQEGYVLVRTKTLSKWESMLNLNKRFHFQTIGYEPSETGSEKIVMERRL